MCDDYRAAYHIDQHHEAADCNSPIKVPFAAVWGMDGVMAKTFDMESVCMIEHVTIPHAGAYLYSWGKQNKHTPF